MKRYNTPHRHRVIKGALRAWAQRYQEWTTASTGRRAGLCMSAATTILKCVPLSALPGRISEKPKQGRKWNSLKCC